MATSTSSARNSRPDPLAAFVGPAEAQAAEVPRGTPDPADAFLGPAGGGETTPASAALPGPISAPAPPVSTTRLGGWSELTPRTRRYARRLRIEVRRKERQVLAAGGTLPPREEHHGFWWLVGQLERVSMPIKNSVYALQGGERDPLKVWQAASRGLTLQEKHQGVELVDRLTPKMQAALYYPYIMMGIQPKTARALLGFGVDMGLDPQTWMGAAEKDPVLALFGRARGFIAKHGPSVTLDTMTALEKSANFWMRATGTQGKLPDTIRRLITRRSGLKELDKLYGMAIDSNHYVRSGLADDALNLMQSAQPVIEKHPGLLTKLAEENHLDDAIAFAQAGRSGKITPEAIARTLEQTTTTGGIEPSFLRFRNPGAVRKLMGLSDEEFQIAAQGAKDTQALKLKTELMQEFEGRRVPELGSQLQQDLAKNERKLNATVIKVIREARREQLQKLSRNVAVFRARKETLSDILGPEGMAGIARAMRQVAGTNPVAAVRKGKVDASMLERVIRRYTESLTPGFVTAMGKISKDRAAIDVLLRNYDQMVYETASKSPKIQNLMRQQASLLESIERVPAWIPHVATEEAVEGLSKLPGEGLHYGTWLRTPRTASDIHRAFAIKGRPLSLEEIEHLYHTHQLEGTAAAAAELDGWIYKKAPNVFKAIWSTAKTGRPSQAIAEFFDADEKVVMAAMADRTARSVSNAQFMNEAARIFGVAQADVARLPDTVRKHFFRLGDLDVTRSIAEVMPGLKDVYFADWQLTPIAQRWNRITNPEPVLRFIDGFGSWLKAYNLPMFAAYHTRNGIGNVINMSLAGFGDHPRDIATAVKVGVLQAQSSLKQAQKVRAIKFYAKAVGRELEGDEFMDLALRHGVVNSGWWGGELGSEFERALHSPLKKLSTWVPGSMNFIGIRGGHAVGRAMENHARMSLFAQQLERGAGVREAAATVKKYLGDFRSEVMTPFEKQVLSRGFLFYRWSRYNIPLWAEQLVTSNRARVKLLNSMRAVRVGQTLGGTEDLDVTDLPEEVPLWVKESAGVPVKRDPKTGELTYWIWKNWHPAADLDDMMGVRNVARFLTLQAHPVIGKGIELAMGRSLYFDQPLRGHQTEFLGQEMDAEAMNQMRMLRAIGELDRLDPLSNFHTRRKLQDWKQRVLLRAAGITLAKVNPARERMRLDADRLVLLRERRDAARDLLKAKAKKEE